MRDDRTIEEEEDGLAAFAERVAAPLRTDERLDATFESRLMASVRADAVARRIAEGRAAARGVEWARTPAPARLWRWFVAPRMVPLSPALLAAAALIVAVGFGAWRSGSPAAPVGAAIPSAVARVDGTTDAHVVRFVLVAPAASTVSLVGDFNGWDPAGTPLRATSGNGVWTVDVPLAPGRHLYAFLVDGERWVTDPAAPTAVEDDFGTPNSVVTVPERAA